MTESLMDSLRFAGDFHDAARGGSFKLQIDAQAVQAKNQQTTDDAALDVLDVAGWPEARLADGRPRSRTEARSTRLIDSGSDTGDCAIFAASRRLRVLTQPSDQFAGRSQTPNSEYHISSANEFLACVVAVTHVSATRRSWQRLSRLATYQFLATRTCKPLSTDTVKHLSFGNKELLRLRGVIRRPEPYREGPELRE